LLYVLAQQKVTHVMTVAPATNVDRQRFFTSVEQARAELGSAGEHLGEAGLALREVVGEGRRDVQSALAEMQVADHAARAAEGELALLEGRAHVLDGAEAGVLTEAEGAAPEAAAVPEAGAFTEADLQRIGSGLDPAKRPPQTLWNENMVNMVSSEGRRQGGITEEQGGRNAELARSLLDPEGKGETSGTFWRSSRRWRRR
jgi:hypothetical protein